MVILRRERPPPQRGIEAGVVGKNRDSEPKSNSTASSQRCDRQVLSTRCRRTLIAGSKRRSLLMTGDDDEMFMTRSHNVTPKTTEQRI